MNKTSVALWVLQGLLALFFGLASGLPKLIVPADVLPMPIPIAQPLLWFIGIAEVAGAIGLLLPGISRVRTDLTPLAAIGLATVAGLAAVYQLMAGQPESAVFAVVVSVLCLVVAYGRARLAPRTSRQVPVPAR